EGFNKMTGALRPDVLIVARGGGSVEDLWGFNEEAVVRAVAASAIPVISAVGHETDTTLIDHAADLRAPTPTAAAERAVPVRADLIAMVADLEARRTRALALRLERGHQRLADLSRALPRPERLLEERRQRLDNAAIRLPAALRDRAGQARLRLARLAGRLVPSQLSDRLDRASERLAERARGISRALERRAERARADLGRRSARLLPGLLTDRVARSQEQFSALARLYGTLHYDQTLKRGFALVRSEGAVLGSSGGVSSGMALEIEFHDGRVDAVAGGTAARRPAPRKKPRASKPEPDDQGSLF
ncbi:MAG: exodeoxyribonuclease VII large subunit, partial [Pseudomonadota bacterium]